jgi:hypothetical protein
MSKHQQLDLTVLRRLADRLQLTPRVRRIAGVEAEIENVATEAASALLQIQRACSVLNSLCPMLDVLPPESAEFAETLDDIAEEFRLIYYQVVNTRLFNYVVPG